MIKKISITASILILIISIFAIKDIKNGREKSISKYLPDDLKILLKKTIFIVPTLHKKIEDQNNLIEELKVEKIKTLATWKDISRNSIENISFKKVFSTDLKISNKKYKFEKFLMPLPDYYTWKKKSVGYLDHKDNYIYFVSGDGYIFRSYDSNFENKQNIRFKQIKSNILNFLDKNTLKAGKISIKDILIKNNKIYISYNFEKKKDCFNVQIVSGELNDNYISFIDFFSYDECYGNKELHSSGGRIVNYSENEILFSLGEGLNRRLAQNKDSIFGKILKIDLITQKYKIISMGHRNPQGLYYDRSSNLIFSTEHGPSGGDEININLNNYTTIPNFGWPISSYGEHYPGKITRLKAEGKLNELLEEAPLNKSHKDFGFVEPLKYFTPSIGISEIIKLPNNIETNLKDIFIVAAMGLNIDEGDKSLHYFHLDKKNKIKNINYTVIGERVRDLIYYKNSNSLLMILENTPALGVINLN